jgi:hypothetical protein
VVCLPLRKVTGKYCMDRPLCPVCHSRPVAVNCHRNNKVYYRRVCDVCARAGKKFKPMPPSWFRAGYRKQTVCDKCGWRAKYPDRQMTVFYVDGNLKNNNLFNLKSVCLNCRVEIATSKLPWRESPLTPDF